VQNNRIAAALSAFQTIHAHLTERQPTLLCGR
jgi:hypothetical protein